MTRSTTHRVPARRATAPRVTTSRVTALRVTAILAGLSILAGLAGCGGSSPSPGASSSGSSSASKTSKSQREIVTSFYPLAYAAERVGGSHVHVRNLTPSGVEPHDLELATDDVDAIENAFLAVVMGRNFQPAVEKAAAARKNPTLSMLNVVMADDPRVVGDTTPAGDPGGLDPHIWLDPSLMIKITESIRNSLDENDRSAKADYDSNAAALVTDLTKLDTDYRTGLAHCVRHEIVTAHEAFALLAARYGLTQQGVAGISPSQEPDPARLASIADLVKKLGITTIFTEDLVPKAVAETVARETGAKTAVLSPLEGLPHGAAGADYLSVMRDNLAALRTALGCT